MAPFFGIAFSILLYLVATLLIELAFAWIGKRFFGEEEPVEDTEERTRKERPIRRSEKLSQEESADSGVQRSTEQDDYINELLQK